ncbi:MAG: DUF87 domain-containing protein [Ruminococcus flavefaciens]|nr:DUF87 domain-containing protein [Ruminococcus flavefaciens]
MRIIPKKIKVKNTVWKCYSMVDVIIALIVFALIFVAITAGKWALAVILGLLAVGMFMPTPDGIFYTCVYENIRFLFAKKKYAKGSKNVKTDVDAIVDLKEIKESGLLVCKGGMFGRVIKVGQKNFGIEDVTQQNLDINYFANALKQLDQNQCADIVKIDRPVNLDGFAKDLFNRIAEVKASNEESGIKKIKEKILRERIDRIDKLNNVRKQYLSDYYIVLYGRNELDLENTAVNVASEINKCGISTQLLGMKETAVFIKYSFSRDFDEREIKEIKDDELLDWVKPKEVIFHANRYEIDKTQAAVLAVSDYPLRVKNAWGSELFNIPNTKVVMRIKPVDKYKAIRRIDRCIGEMETKQIITDKASEANSAETHKATMDELLNALQTENESLFDVTLTVTAYNYKDKENYKKNARRAMLTGNFRPSALYGLQMDGFKTASVSPVSLLKNNERGINSSSLAAVFPFVRTFVMDEGGIMLGENNKNGYPFIFNLWKRGNLYQNSNGFVIGKSGSGKSFFLKNLILNEWANGTRVIMLDPEAEYLALTRNLYGNVINVGNSREGRINPFHIYKILTEDGTAADSKVTFNTHLKTLESFFKIVLADAPKDVIELINNLTVETYMNMGITENTDCSNFPAEYFPIFSDLLETLKGKDTSKMDEMTKRDMRTAELYLEKFVTGRYSDIWNAPSTLKVNANLIDFDFQSLFANKNNVVANAQMLLVFRFIEQEVINARERNRNGGNLRTLIIADEAHLYIDPKFPIALDFFYSMSKRIRKYNGSFIPATQNIADWNANEELRGKTSAIIKNSQYTYIFKLSAPDMKDVLDVYRTGDSFNDEEQRQIISAVTGQAFFVGSSELRTSVRIKAGETARGLFSEEKLEEEESES